VTINRTALKNYAPKARQSFIAAAAARASKFGIFETDTVPMQEQADVVIIGGEAFPRKVGAQRKALAGRIKLHGFSQTMEEVAYTWFNRFLAIRYMEVHGYLDHGYRVLSHPDGGDLPEVLEHAEHLDLAGLDTGLVEDLKLDGNKDAELYRLLLIAQCNALHGSMPFLFEKIDDETELLLPDNLLHSDSLIRQLVNEIDEADWQEIEVIGWLYQFYISEKKDQVIGKVVKSEDIPAATQLFTPNWIVKYMVQNSLGHQWMATYPESSLKDEMDYYIEPAEQTPEVQAQLVEITPKELNPEELTLLDPAAGSGHILVEAYDLFKQIYLERGYRLKDIPRLILEKNLYGLDIDDRAAQMAGFALLMKARADDRRILSNPVHLNVMAIQSSEGLEAENIAEHLLQSYRYELVASDDLLPDTLTQPTLAVNTSSGIKAGAIESLINLFGNAKTFGSLITVPDNIQNTLPALGQLLDQPSNGDLLQRQMRKHAVAAVRQLIAQANILGQQYDYVVVNPPYMGTAGMSPVLRKFLEKNFPHGKTDLFASFILRTVGFTNKFSNASVVVPFVWMFISSYKEFRNNLLRKLTFNSLIELEYNAFEPACIPVCSLSFRSGSVSEYKSRFLKLSEFKGHENQAPKVLEAINRNDCGWLFETKCDDFLKIPDNPFAYWAGERLIESFAFSDPLKKICPAQHGMKTGNNDRFLRCWWEVAANTLHGTRPISENDENGKWFFYNKGGKFQKWYGNNNLVVDFDENGKNIRKYGDEYNKSYTFSGRDHYTKSGITWSGLTSSTVSFRYSENGFVFDSNKGAMIFPESPLLVLGFLNSCVAQKVLKLLNPTLSTQNGDIDRLPFLKEAIEGKSESISPIISSLIKLSQESWNREETSWGFMGSALRTSNTIQNSIEESYFSLESQTISNLQAAQRFETENNRFFIEAYGLQGELIPDISDDQITLARADREEDVKRLISYSVGCMMGRYSLAEEGLICASSGNEVFDPSRYGDFPADDDGIVPVTDTEWFDDDAAVRIEEFLKVAWSPATLKENLKFIGGSLASNGGNDPLKTIRNYLSKGFYKDHLKNYKKRPVYWLFSSGRQRAFECLVYLHRYNEGTLARMRMEYVTPLQGRMSARIDQLVGDVDAASSSAERNRKQKEKDKLVIQLEELRTFDEELRHYADQRIGLDLDDGVKVNYSKFGNLLAETKVVTGKK
jgi:hypothetical protein